DGDTDVDVIELTGFGHAVLLLNDGSGTLAEGATLPFADFYAVGAALGDLDGDQDLDLIELSTFGDIRLLENDGHGGFAVTGTLATMTYEQPHPFVLVDSDGDHDLDLVVFDQTSRFVVLRNDGHGQLGPAEPIVNDPFDFACGPALVDV